MRGNRRVPPTVSNGSEARSIGGEGDPVSASEDVVKFDNIAVCSVSLNVVPGFLL